MLSSTKVFNAATFYVWNGIRRTQSLRAQMVIIDQVSNVTAARAYTQQGHGKILKPIQRPDTYQRLPENVQLNTCEQQPVHTLGSKLPLPRLHIKKCAVAALNVRFLQVDLITLRAQRTTTFRPFC